MEWEVFYKRMMGLGKTTIDLFYAEAMEVHKEDFLNLNRKQLSSNMTSLGTSIAPPYSEKYAKFKGFRTPDLKLSGDFHKSIKIRQIKGRDIDIGSDLVVEGGFPLGQHLEGLVGEFDGYANIYGLTPENKLIFANKFLYPFIIKKIKYALQL